MSLGYVATPERIAARTPRTVRNDAVTVGEDLAFLAVQLAAERRRAPGDEQHAVFLYRLELQLMEAAFNAGFVRPIERSAL